MGGALLAGIGASICCIGPLLFVALGLGGAAMALSFEPYRPWFMVLSALLLALSFFRAYRCPLGASGRKCRRDAGTKLRRILLWAIALLVLAALTFPHYAHLIG